MTRSTMVAAETGDTLRQAQRLDGVVDQVGGGGNDHDANQPGGVQPFHQAQQHGLAQQRQQHLARQAG